MRCMKSSAQGLLERRKTGCIGLFSAQALPAKGKADRWLVQAEPSSWIRTANISVLLATETV